MPGAVVTVTQNTRIRTDATFTPAGLTVPADPITVKLYTRAPGGPTPTEYVLGGPGSPIVKDGVGLYHAYVTLTTPGAWWISWAGIGAGGPIVVGEVMVKVEDAVNV